MRVSFYWTVVILSVWWLSSFAEGRNYKASKNWENTLEGKYARLTDLIADTDVIRDLGTSEFQHLFVKEPRNYSGFVLFNTHRHHCHHCQLALKNIRRISSSYTHLLGRKPEMARLTFFLEVLEEDEPEILRMVGIGPANLPTLFYFPSHGNLEDLQELELGLDSVTGRDLEDIAQWVLEISNIGHEPVNNSPDDEDDQAKDVGFWNNLTKYLAIALFICNLMKYSTIILNLVANQTSTVFGVIFIMTVCYFTSGHTFNRIKGVQIAGQTSSGYYFIYPDPSRQFGAESFFIFCLYCAMTASTIVLIEVRKPGGKGIKSWIGKLAAALALAAFNIILRIFNGKLDRE